MWTEQLVNDHDNAENVPLTYVKSQICFSKTTRIGMCVCVCMYMCVSSVGFIKINVVLPEVFLYDTKYSACVSFY